MITYTLKSILTESGWEAIRGWCCFINNEVLEMADMIATVRNNQHLTAECIEEAICLVYPEIVQ